MLKLNKDKIEFIVLIQATFEENRIFTLIYHPLDTHSQKATQNASFVPAALNSCMFEITEQDPVSHIKTEPVYLNDLIQKYIPVSIMPSESCLPLTMRKSHTAINVQRIIFLIISSQAVE